MLTEPVSSLARREGPLAAAGVAALRLGRESICKTAAIEGLTVYMAVNSSPIASADTSVK
jgi:hypothetical protein